MMIVQWCRVFANSGQSNARRLLHRTFSSAAPETRECNKVVLFGRSYITDEWTNVTANVVSKLNRKLHVTPYHPLSHIRRCIVNYFHTQFYTRVGNPLFSIHDNISPVVTVAQNFDSLLVSEYHPSRQKGDCYYINKDILLRAHMTAHQAELISVGLNNFIVIGDVYRRDEIDAMHYPVFHQADGVRLRTAEDVFQNVKDSSGLELFERNSYESLEKQECYTLEAVKIMEHELKNTLTGLVQALFGPEILCRWVKEYFPFTHPSWELEIYHNGQWVEILGCGIMRQTILQNAGVGDRIGWAFGLGLERLAMCLYGIPDIRLFWSKDSGFLNQFKFEVPTTMVQYKPISIHPQCKNDISFWLPESRYYSENDFYDIVRDVCGDRVEQIILKDKYVHPETNRTSYCYTIVYRHMERPLSKLEANNLHCQISELVTEKLHVTVRS